MHILPIAQLIHDMSIFGPIHLQHWYPDYPNPEYMYIHILDITSRIYIHILDITSRIHIQIWRSPGRLNGGVWGGIPYIYIYIPYCSVAILAQAVLPSAPRVLLLGLTYGAVAALRGISLKDASSTIACFKGIADEQSCLAGLCST